MCPALFCIHLYRGLCAALYCPVSRCAGLPLIGGTWHLWVSGVMAKRTISSQYLFKEITEQHDVSPMNMVVNARITGVLTSRLDVIGHRKWPRMTYIALEAPSELDLDDLGSIGKWKLHQIRSAPRRKSWRRNGLRLLQICCRWTRRESWVKWELNGANSNSIQWNYWLSIGELYGIMCICVFGFQ